MKTPANTRSSKAAYLKCVWLQVRKNYFPHWDRQKRWKIRLVNTIGNAHGLCDDESRQILIRIIDDDPDEMTLLVIHEICHAVTSGNHGAPFFRRMEKAAKRAAELGQIRLSELILKEIAGYKDEPELRHSDIYNSIEDAVLGNPEVTFEQVVRFLCEGIPQAIKEFEPTYKRARKVFEKAKQRALESRKWRLEWAQKMKEPSKRSE